MKVVAAHQPQYLPWQPFIGKAAGADILIYLDNVQFHRRGVQNRNAIKGASGPLNLTVPVIASRNCLIKDVRLAEPRWARKHIGAVRHSYAHAPYIDWFDDGLRPVLERPWVFLVDLNVAVTAWMFELLGVNCTCVLASELRCEGKREDLILSLCQAVGATVYLSGEGARAYQEPSKFHQRGIDLKYQRYVQQPYSQQRPDLGFISDLSALDLLLNAGPEAKAIFRNGQREPE